MAELVEPVPRSPRQNAADGGLGHAKHVCNREVWCGPPDAPYLADLLRGQLNAAVALASVFGAVGGTIFDVLGWCGPPDMTRIHAAKVPVAAVMSGLVARRRRLAVDFDTGNPVHRLLPTIVSHFPVAVVVTAKGPDQAFVRFAGQHYVSKILLRLAKAGAALVRVWARDYTGVSHLDLSKGWAWLEPVAALERSAGSLFVLSQKADFNGLVG